MGDRRCFADEECFNHTSDNGNGDSIPTCTNRALYVSGYKKVIALMIVVVLGYCFRTYVIERVIVSGRSMEPNYLAGDVLWARKYNLEKIERYQVVVARMDYKYVIKRVIGLPNETVQIIDGLVYINGMKLNEQNVDQTTFAGCAVDQVTLKENEYFLMGDNRNHSLDSRIWGAVEKQHIKGIIFFRIFPFWEIEKIE